jgi:hypothetical protein
MDMRLIGAVIFAAFLGALIVWLAVEQARTRRNETWQDMGFPESRAHHV